MPPNKVLGFDWQKKAIGDKYSFRDNNLKILKQTLNKVVINSNSAKVKSKK